MKRQTSPDMPVGTLTRVKDFLPSPQELAMPRDDVKVTLALSRHSIEFFKQQARRNRTKYQRMIRDLVDRYVAHYSPTS